MKKIYIIATYTGTVLSYLIRNISKTPYAHISIALNEDLNPMYSFGRIYKRVPFFAGFVEENINEGLYAMKEGTMCRVYSLHVSEAQYSEIYTSIMDVKNNKNDYDYDKRALLGAFIPPKERDYKYVCSNFVADMLIKGGVSLFDKRSFEITPRDFYDLENLKLEYEGKLSEYPDKTVKASLVAEIA